MTSAQSRGEFALHERAKSIKCTDCKRDLGDGSVAATPIVKVKEAARLQNDRRRAAPEFRRSSLRASNRN
jgi:hypothetical protein